MSKYSLDQLIAAALGLFAFSVIFSVTAVEAALFLTLLLLLVKKYQERTLADLLPSLARHTLFAPWMIYLAVCLLTALTAYYPAKGLGQLNSDFLKYVCLATLLLTVKKEHLPRLASVYIAAAAISSIAGIAEVTISALRGDGLLARAGVFMNAVRYGEAMTIALMLALSRLLLPSSTGSKKERLFLVLAAALIFLVIILTQTRGAYLGTATGIAVLFYFVPSARKKLALYILTMLAAVSVMTAINPAIRNRVFAMAAVNRVDFSTGSPNTGINIRLKLWKLGYKMFKTHPILGIGPDNVKKVFKRFHPEPFEEEGIYGTLNNIYVHQAAERGATGLAALLFLFWAMLIFSIKRFKASSSPYALWALCALPAFYVVNITEISFQHVQTSFAIFMALAFAGASQKETV